MLKTLQQVAGSLGVDLRRRASVRFGADSMDDIAFHASDIRTVFDVGANLGQTVERVRQRFPEARVVSFEPVPETFRALRGRWAHDPAFECHQLALGDASGTLRMTADATSGQNTANISAHPESPVVEVQMTTLDTFLADRGIAPPDVLKIDVEGFEMSVLRGASRALASGKTRFVLAECEFTPNPTEPHGPFFEIAPFLMALGFRMVATYAEGQDGNGWLWGDVLFMLPEAQRPVSCSPHG